MRWLGVIARNSGLNWSPAPILTGITLYSRPNSSRAMCTLWPFGVGHDQTSIIGSSGLRSGSDGASLAGLVPLGEAFEPAARGTVAQPFLEMVAPELLVKAARRVPVEHVEIDPAPPALQRDPGEPRHQPAADAVAARRLADEDVFQIKRRRAEAGRKPRVEQRHSLRFAGELGDQRLKMRLRTKAVFAQLRFGGDDGLRRLFVKRQFADEPQDEAAIFFGRDPYRDMAHRSRHSRGPLPGGPKSLGARPAWNQVTKL